MNFSFPFTSAMFTAALCGLVLGTGGCRKKGQAESAVAASPAVTRAPELEMNGLVSLPGAVYHSQVASPIHWQPWTKETLLRAKAANRLVFGVIALPQQPGFTRILSGLSKDSALVSLVNTNYVPVLIDGDAAREVGLLTADLCTEIKKGLQLPMFVWMTAEGDPVAWIPVSRSANIPEVFNQSHSMVKRMWMDDAAYVMKNSGLDNASRRERIAMRKNSKVMSKQPAQDVVQSLRQLASFYDPYSHSFDEAGGLFPSGAIDLLATAAIHPGLAPDVRSRCMETTRDLMNDLLPSPMFDPLDGGLFSARLGNSWALPSFNRDCVSQARAIVALIHAYRATGDARVLEKALGLVRFSEKNFSTSEGFFSVGATDETVPAAWLWTLEEIEKELPAEDATWWVKATGMKGLGNLPSEIDPGREYFRSNSIGLSKSTSELAAEFGQPVGPFTARFEAVRKKLLEIRSARLGPLPHDDCSHAGATFRMISAYAAVFGVTGQGEFRDKAIALLEKSQAAFSSGPKLRLFTQESPSSVGEGRAFLYGLALQAALDVSAITSDEKFLTWSEDLATTAAELFTDSEFLKECPDDAKLINLPVTDLVMLFDDSTAGLISFAECRLADRKRPLVPTFSTLATPLPTYAVDRPILHTDLLQATLAREFRVTVVAGEGISPELKLATERLPLRMVQRRGARSKDDIPVGSAMVRCSDGRNILVSTPAALAEAVLPVTKK
jgi:uncharacterized protein